MNIVHKNANNSDYYIIDNMHVECMYVCKYVYILAVGILV